MQTMLISIIGEITCLTTPLITISRVFTPCSRHHRTILEASWFVMDVSL